MFHRGHDFDRAAGPAFESFSYGGHHEPPHHRPGPRIWSSDEIPPCIDFPSFSREYPDPAVNVSAMSMLLRSYPIMVYFVIIPVLVLTRNEVPRRRLSVLTLDVLKQLIASMLSQVLFVIVLLTTLPPPDFSDPMFCRIPVVVLITDTVVGLPVLWLSHRLLMRVVRRLHGGISRAEAARIGVESGAYGRPIRKMAFVKQTLVFVLACTFTKFFTHGLTYSARSVDAKIVRFVLGWTWNLGLGPGAEFIVAKVLYPFFFWSIQSLAIDRIIRYNPLMGAKAFEYYEDERASSLSEAEGLTSSYSPRSTVFRDDDTDVRAASPPLTSTVTRHPLFAANHIPATSLLTSLSSYNNLFPARSSRIQMAHLISPSPLGPNSSLASPPGQASSPPFYHTPATPEVVPVLAHADPALILADDNPGEEELPTYADSQRQAAASRESDRARLMDLKASQGAPASPDSQS
ncbi:uncharacterized protein V1510DRAFT_420765 [Dipodascopsis tothii]|uniref:uncharacterized protein n=1 Tax=Dipodascopsis tothii TaxID=44089 RepID=UPI0034CE2F0E